MTSDSMTTAADLEALARRVERLSTHPLEYSEAVYWNYGRVIKRKAIHPGTPLALAYLDAKTLRSMATEARDESR